MIAAQNDDVLKWHEPGGSKRFLGNHLGIFRRRVCSGIRPRPPPALAYASSRWEDPWAVADTLAVARSKKPAAKGRRKAASACMIRSTFQLPTILAPIAAPNPISVRRDRPRHITMFPGGGSLARARYPPNLAILIKY